MTVRLIQALMFLLLGAILTSVVAGMCSIYSQRNYERTFPADISQVWWADPQHLVEPNFDHSGIEINIHESIINSTWATEREPPQSCKRGYVVLMISGFGVTEQHAFGSHHHNGLSLIESFKDLAIGIDDYMQKFLQLIGSQQEAFAIRELQGRIGVTNEILLQTGWPFKAFSGLQIENREKELSGLQLINGCLVVSTRLNEIEDPWIIPVRPLLMGLAANTMLYAGTIWALFFAPGACKRWLRRSRRQCHCCGYPIGVSEVCTECGCPLPVEKIGCHSRWNRDKF